jgi:uncharacterized protein (DUF58 family)
MLNFKKIKLNTWRPGMRWLSGEPDKLPFRFSVKGKNRLLTLPTFYGGMLLPLLLLIILSALNYNNSYAIAVALFITTMYGMSMALNTVPLTQIQLLSVFIDDVEEEVEPKIELSIKNTKNKTSFFQIKTNLKENFPYQIEGNTVKTIAIPIKPQKRGKYEAPRIVLENTLPFGFSKSSGFFLPPAIYWVTPKKIKNIPEIPKGKEEEHVKKFSNQGEQLHHLRNYQRGDSLRDVDWKSSAKTNDLLTRVYDKPNNGYCSIIWEEILSNDIEEKLSIIETWIDEANKKNWSIYLQTPRGTFGPGGGLEFKKSISRFLAEWPGENNE